MSKIETTSQVSVGLTSRINLRKQGAPAGLLPLDTAHKHPPPPLPKVLKALYPGYIVLTGTINKRSKTAKAGNANI